ncbi:ABC transporter ATP-binding protein [Agromyces badenianii]|uniref:ABC transporter ATP-binding protein n=1 Tax=Agromyces badenianii TaxID=2080742 RepID=A0A2S0WTW2_9MICO|nr:ABC transporter ATP-binding protein [Agromyces badenianii]AWB94684.1 ABC transporter ATP-binding protein [Agromyces badenianii]
MTSALVHVDGLEVRFGGPRHGGRVVDDVSFEIAPHESFGLVGESGSGKSTIALALTGHLPASAAIAARTLRVAGDDVLDLDPTALRRYRASRVSVVYQEPGLALNPTTPVGEQVAEVFRIGGERRGEARRSAVDALAAVSLPDPARIARSYPHELSGGQQQRVVIAMALAGRPELLILDEPTTGLDSNVEAEILELVDRLQRELGFATLLISHNLPLVAAHCDRVGVLREGRLVETTTADALLTAPRHSYSKVLIAAVPDFDHPARQVTDAASPRTPLVTLENVGKRYGTRVALDGIDLTIGRGEVLGVVGESGSGKSTLGRAIAGLTPFHGRIELHAERTEQPVQMVFQHPDGSLNPRRSVRQTLSRSIRLLAGDTDAATLAETVGLPRDALEKLPHELSGGQKQRVAIARAFAGPVPLVVCDEPTSALDVSVQARILDLLVELQERTGVSYLFISHDLAVVRQLADHVAVLRQGRLVDHGSAEHIFGGGGHEYTASLVDAAQRMRRRRRGVEPAVEPRADSPLGMPVIADSMPAGASVA